MSDRTPPRPTPNSAPGGARARLQAAQNEAAAGRLREALAHLHDALKLDARLGEAHLGVAELSVALGDPDTALRHYPRATALQPHDAAAPYNHGVLLERLGRFAEAADAYAEAVRRAPGFAPARNNLGATLLRLGRTDAAVTHFEAAAAADPTLTAAQSNLARAWQRLGEPGRAEAVLRSAMTRSTPDAGLVEAWASLRQAQQIAPATLLQELLPALDDAAAPPVVRAIGIELALAAERVDLAAAWFQRAQQARAVDGRVLRAIVPLWFRDGRPGAETLAAVRAAAARFPDDPHAQLALASSLLETQCTDEATTLLARLVQQAAGEPQRAARLMLASLLGVRRRFEQAAALLDAQRAADPQDPAVAELLLICRLGLADWREFDAIEAQAAQRVRAGARPLMFPGHAQFFPRFDPDLQRDLAAKHGRQHRGVPPVNRPAAPPSRPVARRLRVGYASPDFREHAVAYLAVGVFEHHDRARVEVFAYDYGRDDGSPMRARCRAAFEHLRTFGPADPDATIAQAIADDALDVLVDLAGWTGEARVGVLARRPAPVIVNWLGYPGTMGEPRLADFILGDPVVTPAEHAAHFSESIARLPHCYQPNDDRRPIGPTPTRAAAGLPDSAFVFASFNRVEKITPAVFDLWCTLLRELPHTVLWLLAPEPTAQTNLRREASARGIDAARLVFAPPLPHTAHLGRLRCADLVLDTFPYNAHTTGSDALWAGVPMITRLGSSFASRVGASLLTAVGLPDLVARSDSAYLDLARRLATEPGALASVLARLQHRSSSPLFDTLAFTRHLEDTLESLAGTSPLVANTGADATIAGAPGHAGPMGGS